MKKPLLFILSVFFTGVVFAQLEDFENCVIDTTGAYLPEGWVSLSEDADGTIIEDANAWAPVVENPHLTGDATEGICVKANYLVAHTNWLITKQFSPVESGEFSFWARDWNGWNSGETGIEVYVSTQDYTPEYGDEFEVQPKLTVSETDDDTYNKYTIDLSDYAGQNIFVGFKIDNNSTNADGWWIDDVEGLGALVSNKEMAAAATLNIYPNPSNGTVKIENVNNETLTIFNMTGQEVQRFDNVLNNQTLDLDLESGVYFIRTKSAAKKINIVK